MLQKTVTVLACFALCLPIFASITESSAENDHPPTLLNTKLTYYRAQYPEILIINLEGGVDFPADIVALDLILGFRPVSLDYEHPPELREDLMTVSFDRIIRMLRLQAPSAAMFKADEPFGWQEHVCVLTINPHEVASDSLQATRSLLSLPPEAIRQIPHDFRLLPEDYLEFVVDHEIYHCLKSMYVGPQQRSHKQFWAEYNQFIEEQGADAFALLMHIKTRDRITPFANNIKRIRGMSLYNADPDHLTCKALQQVMEIPVEDIAGMSTTQIFELATHIKAGLSMDYADYLQHLASAVQAMKEIGVEALVSEELSDGVKDIPAEPAQVNALVANAHRCLFELTSKKQ